MNSHPLAQFPQTVSRTGARPDNVALVPASLLPF